MKYVSSHVCFRSIEYLLCVFYTDPMSVLIGDMSLHALYVFLCNTLLSTKDVCMLASTSFANRSCPMNACECFWKKELVVNRHHERWLLVRFVCFCE